MLGIGHPDRHALLFTRSLSRKTHRPRPHPSRASGFVLRCKGDPERAAPKVRFRHDRRHSHSAGDLPGNHFTTFPDGFVQLSRPSDREGVQVGHRKRASRIIGLDLLILAYMALDAMLSSSPEPLEPPTGSTGVMDGVPGIAVAEVVLDEAQVVPLVGQR